MTDKTKKTIRGYSAVDKIAKEMRSSEEFKAHIKHLDEIGLDRGDNLYSSYSWEDVFKSHPGFFVWEIFTQSPTVKLSGVEIAGEIQKRFKDSLSFMILGSFWGNLQKELEDMVDKNEFLVKY